MARTPKTPAGEKTKIPVADYAAFGASLVAFGTLALQGYTLHLQDVREQLRDKQAHEAQLAADVRKPLTDISGFLASYFSERGAVRKQLGTLASNPKLSADQAKSDLRRLHNDLANMTSWQESQGVLLPSAHMDLALGTLLNQEAAYVANLETMVSQSSGHARLTLAAISATDGICRSDMQSYRVFREMVRAFLHKADGK